MREFVIREANERDTVSIAGLHAASWMTAYRGLLSDDYLNNDLVGERTGYWLSKMPALKVKEFVLVAESEEGIIGFVAVMDVPENGYDALVDNLHVRPDLKGHGVGAELMRSAARKLLVTGRKSYYLWVLRGNTAAEKFYLSKYGKPADETVHTFGGKTVPAKRFVWSNFDELLNCES